MIFPNLFHQKPQPEKEISRHTWFLPEENEFKHKAQLESQLSVAFGGRAAEEIVFGRISTGAADDISQATELDDLIRAMRPGIEFPA
jgi:ATP-dependent Zn protease